MIPLIKDYNVLYIRTKSFWVALTAGGRFESFDQDVIDGSSVEALLIGVSQFRVMAKHVLSDLQIPFPISKGV